jgi:hypothetical protein
VASGGGSASFPASTVPLDPLLVPLDPLLALLLVPLVPLLAPLLLLLLDPLAPLELALVLLDPSPVTLNKSSDPEAPPQAAAPSAAARTNPTNRRIDNPLRLNNLERQTNQRTCDVKT